MLISICEKTLALNLPHMVVNVLVFSFPFSIYIYIYIMGFHVPMCIIQAPRVRRKGEEMGNRGHSPMKFFNILK